MAGRKGTKTWSINSIWLDFAQMPQEIGSGWPSEKPGNPCALTSRSDKRPGVSLPTSP